METMLVILVAVKIVASVAAVVWAVLLVRGGPPEPVKTLAGGFLLFAIASFWGFSSRPIPSDPGWWELVTGVVFATSLVMGALLVRRVHRDHRAAGAPAEAGATPAPADPA